MSSEFLGIGLNCPLTLDEDKIAIARYEERILQAIQIILGMASGERVICPDFGFNICDLVFAANSSGTVGRVATEVRQVLLQKSFVIIGSRMIRLCHRAFEFILRLLLISKSIFATELLPTAGPSPPVSVS